MFGCRLCKVLILFSFHVLSGFCVQVKVGTYCVYLLLDGGVFLLHVPLLFGSIHHQQVQLQETEHLISHAHHKCKCFPFSFLNVYSTLVNESKNNAYVHNKKHIPTSIWSRCFALMPSRYISSFFRAKYERLIFADLSLHTITEKAVRVKVVQSNTGTLQWKHSLPSPFERCVYTCVCTNTSFPFSFVRARLIPADK